MPAATRPYSPSWVDRLIDWIEGLPIPNWYFYILLYIVSVLGLQGAAWIDGVTPVGQFDALWIFNGVWAATSLGFIHILERSAGRALDKFAPMLPGKEAQVEDYRYQMTEMPARPVLWMSILVAILMIITTITNPGFLYTELSHPLSYLLGVGVLAYSYALAPILIYQGIRLLRSVTKLYRLVDRLNIFHQQPLYAFAGLTMQASFFWLVVANLNFLQALFDEVSSAERVVNYGFNVLLFALAFITFLVPLWGIHQRLAETKEDVLEENSIQIEGAQNKLYAAIGAEDYDKVNGLDNAINSLYKVREQLKGIPTWPWAPGTLRGFLSAVFIPMVLWLLQTLAARYL